MNEPVIVIGPVSGDGLARLLADLPAKPTTPNLWARVALPTDPAGETA
ncbi:hypothetical protein [Microbacterium trichothecenolyticum]|uniref:Uncharacterized protein n=1 Tax=Microbacterium trichothecenolyticum TaxID=69370 RepID=A0A0M2HG24_MICTR|nr:hypothetical protein [Microbacterium trichothecenolyticum]KJL45601.1 hypothetical protein RS82_00153 [Microbacterium trichothecenolyticum]